MEVLYESPKHKSAVLKPVMSLELSLFILVLGLEDNS